MNIFTFKGKFQNKLLNRAETQIMYTHAEAASPFASQTECEHSLPEDLVKGRFWINRFLGWAKNGKRHT